MRFLPRLETLSDRRVRGGFSLIETLVAWTLLAMALLFTMALLAEEPWMAGRLEAHSEVLQIVDDLHESVRAGLGLPLGQQRLDWQALYNPPPELVAEDLVIWSGVERLAPAGLYRVTLRARYSYRRQSYDHVLETLVWRP